MLVEPKDLSQWELPDLKEQWDQKDRGYQVWLTTAGDERIAQEMPL